MAAAIPNKMKQNRVFARQFKIAGLVVALCAFAWAGYNFVGSAPEGAPIKGHGGEQPAYPWLSDFKAGLKQAEQESKPIVIDAWAPWCSSCKVLWKKTFMNEKIQDQLQGFVRIKLNMDEEKNQAYWEDFGIKGLPWVGFLTAEGVELKEYTLNDYEDPEPFMERLKSVMAALAEKR